MFPAFCCIRTLTWIPSLQRHFFYAASCRKWPTYKRINSARYCRIRRGVQVYHPPLWADFSCSLLIHSYLHSSWNGSVLSEPKRPSVWHPPLDRFSVLTISTTVVGAESVQKRSALEPSRRELSENVWFGVGTGTLLIVKQLVLEKRPRAVCYYTVVYTRWQS